jgi:hypothetical protein
MKNGEGGQVVPEEEKPRKPRVSLRVVSEDQAKFMRTEAQKERERQKNL